MIELGYPFTAADVAQLKVGDLVSLSGLILTGRDRFHGFLADGGKPPRDLSDGAIFHCGPVVLRQGESWQVRAAGPTTSCRMETHIEGLLAKHSVRVFIGKGGMGELSRKAFARHGCVYLQAVGGAASLLASRIKSVEGVHFLREFGPAEAVWELMVEGLEAVVTMDSRGRSLHKRVASASKRMLTRLGE